MTRNRIGVDLSKDALDVFDPIRGETRIANARAPIARWASRLGPEDFVVFEATSGCDRVLRAGLEAAGRDFVRLNPLHVWHFARSLNLAKTDRIAQNARFQRDARMLARFGAERQPAPDPYGDPVREVLRALSHRRDQLKRMIAQERNRLGDAGHPLVVRDIRAGIAGLERRLAAFDKAIAEHIARHPALAEDAGLLRSIPGIGPVAATEILAHLPEAGRVDRREVASLAGLAPRAHESGKYQGKRRLGDGRRHLRRAMYMAALSALRHPGFLSDFVARLKADRKPGKVILMAVARRLLVIANAILRSRTPFKTQVSDAA
jgi:transposase